MQENFMNILKLVVDNQDSIALAISGTVTLASLANKAIPNQVNKVIPNKNVQKISNFLLTILDIISITNISRKRVNKYQDEINFLKEVNNELQKEKIDIKKEQ